MRPFTCKIATSEEEEFAFGEGRNYVRLESNATVNVTIKDIDKNQEYTLQAGDDVQFNEFDSLIVSHDGASETSFILYVGKNTKAGSSKVAGSITTDVLTMPEVVISSLPDENSVSKSGGAFAATHKMTGSHYKFLNLYNPVGSGVRLIVEFAEIFMEVTQVRRAIFAIVDGNATSGQASVTNKKGGGSAAAGEVHYWTSTTDPTDTKVYTSTNEWRLNRGLYGNSVETVSLNLEGREKIILEEGFGLLAMSCYSGVTNHFNFEWIEEATA